MIQSLRHRYHRVAIQIQFVGSSGGFGVEAMAMVTHTFADEEVACNCSLKEPLVHSRTSVAHSLVEGSWFY